MNSTTPSHATTIFDIAMMTAQKTRNVEQLTGRTFGDLKVMRLFGMNPTRWICVCIRGEKRVVRAGNLKNGNSTGCGCRRNAASGARVRTHGACGTPEHEVWRGILRRCRHDRAYLDRKPPIDWTFPQFLDEVGPRPSEAHTIERIRNELPYQPGNVRWATRFEQNRNKRTNRFLEWRGHRQILAVWARAMSTSPSNLHQFIARNGFDAAIARYLGGIEANIINRIQLALEN